MAKIKYDQVIVYDLELTTSGQYSKSIDEEIIEIGTVVLNMDNGEISNKKSFVIKTKHKTISKYCEELTGISALKSANGIEFDQAMNRIIKEYGSTNKISAGFGNDRELLSSQVRRCGCRFPFSSVYLDVASLFYLKYGLNSGVGLTRCLKMIDEEFEGEQHRASDDAYNTAKLLRKILKG